MRLPHYLYRTPSGIWQFRQRVPVDMASHLGCRYLKKSLKTRDLRTAQRLALEMAEAYAHAIRMTRGLGVSMSMDGKASVDAAVTAVRNGKDYKLIRRPDGSIEIEAKGRADHELALEAAARIGPLSAEPLVQKIVAEARHKPAASGPDIPDLAIRIAIDEWLESIKPTTLKKTLSIKAAAVGSFAKHYGVRKPLAGAGRVEVGRWIDALRISGLQTPTIVNKASYLRGFFDWAKARGKYPSFAKDENPAAGQIVFRTKEKRARRVLGFKAFSVDQIRILFSPEALEGLSEAAQWGAWIGLYTGARVAEVGQLALADFVVEDGVPSIRITNEGAGQSVKNDASIRTIPIHPALIGRGLLDRVAMLKASGETRLFPKVKLDGVNGAGNWLSKAFTRHVAKQLKLPDSPDSLASPGR